MGINASAQELSLKSADGFEQKAWLTLPKETKQSYHVAVFAHEFGADHTMWDSIATKLRSCGYASLQIDLRGHGDSVMQNGKENRIVADMSQEGLQKSIQESAARVNFKNIPDDLRMWIDSLSDYENIDTENLLFFGASLGGGALIPLLFEYEPKMAVLFSPAASKELGENNMNAIANSSAKILIVSSQGDFALNNAYNYMQKALTPTLLVLPGSGHGSATFELARPFLDTYLYKYLDTCQ